MDKPNKVSMLLDGMLIEYWEVKVLMGYKDNIYESFVTFAKEKDAKLLSVGDIFER